MLPRYLIVILFLLSLPAAAQQTSEAEANNEAAAEMQTALTAAQSVYVWGDMQNCFDERLVFHAEASALTTALAAWGRYQLTPTLKGADAIIEPTYSSGPEVCVIQVRDSHTLKILGSFSEPRALEGRGFDDRFTAMMKSLMSDLKDLAGDSTSIASTTVPPPAPPVVEAAPVKPADSTKLSEKELARQIAQQIQSKLTAAHTLLLVDDTIWDSGQSAIGEPDQFPLFKADMTAWGRYQFVPSVDKADLVIMVDDYMGCVRSIMVTGKLAPQCTPQIRLQVYEPTSLDFVTQVIVPARTAKARPGKPDPFTGSVQEMTDELRKQTGDAAPKPKRE